MNMNNEKGKQVFQGKVDDLLSEKIIRNARDNSRMSIHGNNGHKGTPLSVKPHAPVSRFALAAGVMLCLLLIWMMLRRR